MEKIPHKKDIYEHSRTAVYYGFGDGTSALFQGAAAVLFYLNECTVCWEMLDLFGRCISLTGQKVQEF